MGDAARVIVMTPEEIERLIVDAVSRAVGTVARDDGLLTHEAAADRLGITPNALHKRIHRGLIEPDVRGGRDGARGNRFAPETLSAYLRRHKR